MKSNPSTNLMDDDPSSGYWWNTVGTIQTHNGKIPGPVAEGPTPILVKKKELFVFTSTSTLTTTTTPTTTTKTTTTTGFVVTGVQWRKVYAHDLDGGVFANLEEAKKKNIDDENSKLFSRLYELESMRDNDGMFHFQLCHP